MHPITILSSIVNRFQETGWYKRTEEQGRQKYTYYKRLCNKRIQMSVTGKTNPLKIVSMLKFGHLMLFVCILKTVFNYH